MELLETYRPIWYIYNVPGVFEREFTVHDKVKCQFLNGMPDFFEILWVYVTFDVKLKRFSTFKCRILIQQFCG